MNLHLRLAGMGRAAMLPLCLLALAGAAQAEASSPAQALADWQANGRAQGLARPGTPCQDFLDALGKKPDYVEYLGCVQDDDSYIQPMRARYRVSGALAAKTEAYLGQAFGMPPLEYTCCGWSNRGPFFWRGGPDGVGYEIGMGVETPGYPRDQWTRIPSFDITVGVTRKSP